jgi:hypothetical protein
VDEPSVTPQAAIIYTLFLQTSPLERPSAPAYRSLILFPMPQNPPLARLPLDLEAHARFALIGCAAAGVIALGAVLLWHDVIALVVAVIAGTLALMAAMTAFIFWAMARRWRATMDAYARGSYLAAWTYAPAPWRDYLAGRRARMRLLWLAYVAVFALGGVAVALVMQDDGNLIAGSPWLTVVIGAIAGAGLGALVSLLLAAGGRYTRARLGARQPRCVIGAQGIYVGGDFWPLRDAWQRVTRMTLRNGGTPRLEVERRTWTLYATVDHIDTIPVPPGRESEASAVIAALGFA